MRSAYHALQVYALNLVARRNESCEARANEAPAWAALSRPDTATQTASLHRDTLRQITGLIDIGAFHQRHMVREQLKRYHV